MFIKSSEQEIRSYLLVMVNILKRKVRKSKGKKDGSKEIILI